MLTISPLLVVAVVEISVLGVVELGGFYLELHQH